jgi:hypothetical protein
MDRRNVAHAEQVPVRILEHHVVGSRRVAPRVAARAEPDEYIDEAAMRRCAAVYALFAAG